MTCFHVKSWKDYLKGFVTGMFLIIITIGITEAQAVRHIRIQDMNYITWFFVIVGALVILLQLIPAAMLFFTFITGVYKGPHMAMNAHQEQESVIENTVKEKL
jgi:hypothetical protein